MNAASSIPNDTWLRLAKLARCPRDAWSDAWMLIHGAIEQGELLTEHLILELMKAASIEPASRKAA